MKKILVVAAHPDDEVLGCAGTILKRKKIGDEIHILILGEGVTSRYDIQNAVDRSAFDALYCESKLVAGVLGAKSHTIFGFPDNRFDEKNLLDITKSIEKVKCSINPDVVYTHFSKDLNLDHKITFDAVLTACRPLYNESVKEIYCFETPSSTEFSYGKSFDPNVFSDISEFIEEKIKIIGLYKSEMNGTTISRSEEYIKSLALVRGLSVGTRYAEAFELVRKIE